MEITVEKGARPRVSDGTKMAVLKIDRDRFVGWEHRRDCRALASTAVFEETRRHRRTIKS